MSGQGTASVISVQVFSLSTRRPRARRECQLRLTQLRLYDGRGARAEGSEEDDDERRNYT